MVSNFNAQNDLCNFHYSFILNLLGFFCLSTLVLRYISVGWNRTYNFTVLGKLAAAVEICLSSIRHQDSNNDLMKISLLPSPLDLEPESYKNFTE